MGAGKRIAISVGVGLAAVATLFGFYCLGRFAPGWFGDALILSATFLLASTFAYGAMGDW